MRQYMRYKAHEMLKKAQRKQYKTILERWYNDDKYRKSLSDIGWTEEQIFQYDAIALEDHSYMATWQERSPNGKSWKMSLNAEGIQGTLNQRSDLSKNAKDCMTNGQQSLEMETNLSLLDNKSGYG